MTKVKIFVTESGNTLNSMEQFLKRLTLPKNIKIAKEVGACGAILGFCPVISRVGTDIEAALKEFRGLDVSQPSKFIHLVVLHHTYDKDHVVPDSNKYATDRVYIVNCLFHEDGGLLKDCVLNDNAIKQTFKNLKDIKGKIKEEKKANRKKGNPKQNMGEVPSLPRSEGIVAQEVREDVENERHQMGTGTDRGQKKKNKSKTCSIS